MTNIIYKNTTKITIIIKIIICIATLVAAILGYDAYVADQAEKKAYGTQLIKECPNHGKLTIEAKATILGSGVSVVCTFRKIPLAPRQIF